MCVCVGWVSLVADTEWGKLSSPGMFSFGSFDATGQNERTYSIYEVPFFIVRLAIDLTAITPVIAHPCTPVSVSLSSLVSLAA